MFQAIRYCIFILTICSLTAISSQSNSLSENKEDNPKVCEAPALLDMTGSVNWGDGTVSSCTQASLQTLINAGGKIKCNCGTNPFTLILSSTLTVPIKEVIIDGNDKVTISGNNTVRIFDKSAAANQAGGTLFGLQNIVLANGKAALAANDRGGAAILGRAFGSMKMYNVVNWVLVNWAVG